MRIKTLVQLGLLSSVIFALAGCGTSKNYALAVNSWQGAPESALTHEWGNPNVTSTLANGHKLVTYRVVEKQKFPKSYAPVVKTGRVSPQNTSGMLSHAPAIMHEQDETFWCETQFEVNHAGMIVKADFKGNNCTATGHNAQRWAFAR